MSRFPFLSVIVLAAVVVCIRSEEASAGTSGSKTSSSENGTVQVDFTPIPGQLGYLPEDGSTVGFNPPTISWVVDAPDFKFVRTFNLQISTDAAFSKPLEIKGHPFGAYTHNATLSAGTYYWRYQVSLTGQAGKATTSPWSKVRSFKIPAEATALPCPDPSQQAAALSGGHPRLYLKPGDLGKLRSLAKGAEAARFNTIRADADAIIQMPLPVDPMTTPETRWQRYTETKEHGLRCATLAFAYLITEEAKYKEAAVKWLMHLAKWEPVEILGATESDRPAGAMLFGMSRAYDWLYPVLSPEQRATVQNVIKKRGTDLWNAHIIRRGHVIVMNGSHPTIAWPTLGEAAIAFHGEIPEAADWLNMVLHCFFASCPMKGTADDEGGYNEGVHYFCCHMQYHLHAIAYLKAGFNIDGIRKPFFQHAEDFLLYMAVPGSPSLGFDDHNTEPLAEHPFVYGDVYYLQWMTSLGRLVHAACPASNAPYWTWWLKKMGGLPNEIDHEANVLDFITCENRAPDPLPKSPQTLPTSKVFHGSGIASLHTSLVDGSSDVRFLFKSSPMGTAGHAATPANVFKLDAYGESLFPAVESSTAGNNGVLVNHTGQPTQNAAATGKIFAESFSPTLDYVAGDATAAYFTTDSAQRTLTRFHRHVLFSKPDVIVIYDDLAAPAPATFQWMLHSFATFNVDAPSNSLNIERPKAGADVKYLSPVALTYRQTEGENIDDGDVPKWKKKAAKTSSKAPKSKVISPKASVHHVEAGTSTSTDHIEMLTVIVPYRAGSRPKWTAERIETPQAIAARVTRGTASTVFAFRKSGVTGPVTIAGTTFDAPFTAVIGNNKDR